MMTNRMRGNRALNSADRDTGNVRNAGRDEDLINPILTKREHRKANGSLHPQSRRAYGLLEGGGRLQFCLLHSMRLRSEGEANLLFFTFARFDWVSNRRA
jgi:hypothetical protein